MPRRVRRLLGLCLLPLAFAAAAQTAYRWVAEDGSVVYSDQPPPAHAHKAEKKRLGPANAIAGGGPGFALEKAVQAAPVTLYTSPECGAECQAGRDYLKRLAIPYGEKSVRSAEDAAAYKKLTGSGDLVVPTLVVGTQTQAGFEAGAWRSLLDIAAYPLSERDSRPPP